MIELIPTEWLERCLDIMAMDPETAQPSVGLPCGRRRNAIAAHCWPYNPADQDLQCNSCGAGWVGIVGEPCGWCAERLERQRDDQAELLLRAPEVHCDDVNYDVRMRAWADRMAVGVHAGLITAKQVDRAWTRTLEKRPA